MSTRNQDREGKNLFQQIGQLSKTNPKQQMQWLLRGLLIIGRQLNLSTSGFVLPTVAMVSLVIVLLTTTLAIRSFDRSRYASNVRVDQATINAATPALDRARAKLDALFSEPTLPPATPSDTDLYNAIANNLNKYTLGDEKPLKLVHDIDGGGIKPDEQAQTLEQRETLTTAWRFPVDTDNNGKYDSYTLYGIYFRSPTRDRNGQFNRRRNPLEARTPPMNSAIALRCAAALGTEASFVGDSGWYKSGEQLQKSFYVYTATVPITNTNPPTNYETYKSNKSFSALEYQQDRARIPFSNNAVVYEGDLEIAPDTDFRLNGRIVTNSNLLTGKSGGGPIELYQISSKDSCYYKEENSKIVVGGNVAAGSVMLNNDPGDVNVHLFKGAGLDPDRNQTISSTNKSTSNAPREVAYNTQAYAQRIALLVEAQFDNDRSSDPVDVQNKVNAVSDEKKATVRRKKLEIYFRNRTRRVPFSEVPYGTDGTIGYTTSNVLQGSGDTLRPPDAWMYPTSPSDGITGTGYTGLNLKTAQLQATEPQEQQQSVYEKYLGDRIYVGNNLPAFWFQDEAFVGAKILQKIFGATWTESSATRYRLPRVQPLADPSITDRDGFWEAAAAKPTTVFDNNGGLRVVTGAGVYSRVNSFLPQPTCTDATCQPTCTDATCRVSTFPIVWPDTMPMTLPGDSRKGDLKMRATVVYHYAKDAYDPNTPADYQTPIACVSSYYDPSTRETALDMSVPSGKSNNGLSYDVPTTTAKDITTGLTLDSNGLFLSSLGADNPQNSSLSLVERLKYQANLKFTNGRFVNEALRDALINKANNQNLTLSEQSAIDATICALKIADGTLARNNSVIPDNAIKELAFLDARQIKAIENDANLTGYNLSIEERQPLEIRATVLDMDLLRRKAIAGPNVPVSTQEYLLPNSGIIYASRDDALLDLSDKSISSKLLSPIDFKLDPTRRPNGILLTNGSKLWRKQEFRQQEKGLILATNLPVYVKGDFNLHSGSGEEFTNKLQNDWSNFYDRMSTQINYNFACRPSDPKRPNCTTGDDWRSATVLADAITLLSDNFRFGFRNEGDYDLRNNQSDRNSIDKRLKNGFWNNNFVTSRDFQDSIYSGNTATPNDGSSYFNNFVTPIQRRVSFPEYLMEVCTKLPVSECGPNDWYVNPDTKTKASDAIGELFSLTNHPAGTTGKTAAPQYQGYARRVAFERNTDNTLKVAPWPSPSTNTTAIPIGISSSDNKIDRFPYDNSNGLPQSTNNTLWFRTTNNTNGNPGSPTEISYASNKPLYYLPPDQAGTGLILPDTPCFTGTGVVDCQTTADPAPLDTFNLNLPRNNPDSNSASSYTICLFASGNTGNTVAYQNTGSGEITNGSRCPGAPNSGTAQAINNAYNTLKNLTGTAPNASGSLNDLILTAAAKVNIYDLTSDFPEGAKITLKADRQTDPIFVLRGNSSMKFGAGVTVTLPDGVNPNNVFWVIQGDLQLEDATASTTRLVGNFIGNATVKIGKNVTIDGGRLLGFSNAPAVDGSASTLR